MRILHISTRLILGGSQENTVLSCEEQARRGHEVHLAFGPIYGPEGSLLERVERFSAPGGARIATHVIPHMVREIAPLRDWRALRQTRELIRRLRPDIVHTHSSKAGILGRAAAFSVARSSPDGLPGVVHTIHGPPFMPSEGSAISRLKVRVNNAIYTLAERFAARRCHAIISVADAMTNQFLARGIGTPSLYATVRSGMEAERFLTPAPGDDRASVRAALGLNDRHFVVGTVARLAQHKGHDDLLDALGEDLRANADWRLLWVGDGWWRERLLERVRVMGVSDRVITTGLVPPERVGAMIRAMDVLAHPSVREGLPRTVPQALLCGVCPVAYDVDGTGEACIEMRTGRLVRAGDRSGLRSAIRWCFDNPAERALLAERGREMCARQFSVGAMVDGLDAQYARAIALAKNAGVRRA